MFLFNKKVKMKVIENIENYNLLKRALSSFKGNEKTFGLYFSIDINAEEKEIERVFVDAGHMVYKIHYWGWRTGPTQYHGNCIDYYTVHLV